MTKGRIFTRLVGGLPLAALALAAGAMMWLLPMKPQAAETVRPIPAATVDEAPSGAATEVAVLAGGCFWGVQGVFQHMKGVTSAVSGYAGGSKETARYETVSSGRTGHAESVRITFNPREVSFGRILQVYFAIAHDPTQRNRQGPDVGTQYRSAIFTNSAEQAKVAKAYIAQLDKAGVFNKAIATDVTPLKGFYPAEDYHQNYLVANPTNPYIVVNDLPKVENLQRVYPDYYRADPVLVAVAGASH